MQTITMYLRAASVKGTLVDEWNQALSSLPALTRGMRAELVLKFVDANGAAMGVPYAIVAGTSAGYTYASAKLDHQTYFRILRNERGFMEDSILNRLFELWLREWSLAHPDLGGPQSSAAEAGGSRSVATGEEGAADSPPLLSTWNASWLWPMFDNIDMLTAARVQSIAIKNRTTTLATEYARPGPRI